ncbi:MAG: NERD domain-containing protein [Saprospiraceae bacterium]|nr:NERD domain-containing protein [Saprospiraceae bacterium]
MALFYPSIEKIKQLTVQPEAGELHLLNFLSDLDDSFEIFFNPFLNGDRPDIIIVRKNYGIMIIEVKDWELSNYYLDEKRKWRLKKNNAYLKSPIDQVLNYKENLYNLHVERLLERKITNFKYWNIVSCALYFHNETKKSLNDFLVKPFEENKKYQDFLKWNIELLANDNLNANDFTSILQKKYLIARQPSFYFNDELYESIKRYLVPPIHTKEEGEEIPYSKQQQRLTISEARDQRIKGVVGSGKTTVLAARAVNAHLRTQSKVLILCYNITLRNYIHDKISKVREEFSWDSFYITNYHNFITAEMNNNGIDFTIPEDFASWTTSKKSEYFEDNYYSNEKLFEENKDKFFKYKTILIDEIQDYKRPWMDVIKKCFLAENGEYVLFGDEKQNIYSNEIENKDIKTNVQQNPSTLKDCFRSNKKIKDIAIGFQSAHFKDKYDIDDFNKQLEFSFEKPSFCKYFFTGKDINVSEIFNTIKDISNKLGEHPNNITILGVRISVLRELDCYYRYKTNEKTNSMFETQEVWYKLLLETFKSEEVIKRGIDLFGHIKDTEAKKNKLAVLLAIKDLTETNPEPEILSNYKKLIEADRINKEQFELWYSSQNLSELLNRDKRESIKALEKKYPEYKILTKKLKMIRDNKKFHFWYARGTMKISTIHSFKGWEANTLFLLLEEDWGILGDFPFSFEELIYTGLTRSKRNLIILNCGNMEYHETIKDLIEKNE